MVFRRREPTVAFVYVCILFTRAQNADMVHASYARLLDKMQKMEEHNGQLQRTVEKQKSELNKVRDGSTRRLEVSARKN